MINYNAHTLFDISQLTDNFCVHLIPDNGFGYIYFSVSIGLILISLISMSGAGKKFGEKVLNTAGNLGSAVSGAAGLHYLSKEYQKSNSSSNSSGSKSSNSSGGKSSNSSGSKSGSKTSSSKN